MAGAAQPRTGLSKASSGLGKSLQKVKASLRNVSFDWYRYDTFGNVGPIERLLAEAPIDLMEFARANGVLDIGCGDGELSFLFESLGCQVTAIDYSVTNHNSMLGIAALKERTGSAIEIFDVNIDHTPELPATGGVCLLLGVLYHVRNPLLVLEAAARASRYCLFSTRVARKLPDGLDIATRPLAYLLDPDELNADDSNFWILSPAALSRVFSRTNWRVVSGFYAGSADNSDPVSITGDERYFCLLESEYGLKHLDLTSGWHVPEGTGWRWTERRFSVRLAARPSMRLLMNIYVPPTLIERFGPTAITLRDGRGYEDRRELMIPGAARIVWELPALAGPSDLEFELDHAIPSSPDDIRELGIIVARMAALGE